MEGSKDKQPLLSITATATSTPLSPCTLIYRPDPPTSAALINRALVVVEVREHADSMEVVAGILDHSLGPVFDQMLQEGQRLPH